MNNEPSPPVAGLSGRLTLFSLAAAALFGAAFWLAPTSAVALAVALAAIELARYLYLRRLLQPLGNLLRSSQRISDGELQERAAVEGPREVRQLAVTFNHLMEQFEASQNLKLQVEAAEAASRLKSQFVANMSHEIRTPMNGILGMAQVLLQGELTARQRKQTQTMCDSAEALLRILDDILDISKIEAQKLQLEIVDFNLRDVVEGVADLMAVKAHQKGLEMISFIEPAVPTALRGDPVRLRQILSNLAGNAIKFTSKGEVAMRVKRAPAASANTADDAATNRILIEIVDTGIGIPQDKRGLLFQPFSQLDASMTRRFGGTGLGLSIVRALVEMMHGEVGVDSEEGTGSRFWFTAVLDRQPEVRRPNALSLKGRRVLVVEANARSRGLLTEFLDFWQADAEVAPDAAVALDRLQNTARPPFEAILIDLNLPGMRGDRLAAAVRRIPGCEHIPMALLAPITVSEASIDWRSMGFALRVNKPIKQGELGGCLASLLGYGPPPAALTPVAASQTEKDRAARAQVRLLLVEDNEVNQEVALGILEILGYRAEVASEAESALKALAATRFDAILMDCQLPGMDGYQLSGVIRDPHSAVLDHGIPIIAVTAHAMAGSREKCFAAGMNGFVTKPLRPAALESEIARMLAGRKETPPPAVPLAANPTTPLAANPTEPLATNATTPLTTNPATPLAANATEPLATNPTTPLTTNPATPLAANPTEPLTTNPATPRATPATTPLTANPTVPLAPAANPAEPAQPAQSETPAQLEPAAAFDRDGFLDRLMGNEMIARRVATRFLGDMPQQLASLSAALEAADPAGTRLAAHSIKGAAANIGGDQVREIAWQMEQCGASGDLAAAAELLSSLKTRYESLKPELEQFIDE